MMYCTFMLPKNWKIVSLGNIFRWFFFSFSFYVSSIYSLYIYTYSPGIIVFFILIAFVILGTTQPKFISPSNYICNVWPHRTHSRTIDLVVCAHSRHIQYVSWLIWNRINIFSFSLSRRIFWAKGKKIGLFLLLLCFAHRFNFLSFWRKCCVLLDRKPIWAS